MAKAKKKNNQVLSKNEVKSLQLSPNERINLLTNLIIDRIIHDQNHGRQLLAKIRREIS